jgi:hypothetical protein
MSSDDEELDGNLEEDMRIMRLAATSNTNATTDDAAASAAATAFAAKAGATEKDATTADDDAATTTTTADGEINGVAPMAAAMLTNRVCASSQCSNQETFRKKFAAVGVSTLNILPLMIKALIVATAMCIRNDRSFHAFIQTHNHHINYRARPSTAVWQRLRHCLLQRRLSAVWLDQGRTQAGVQKAARAQ